MLTHDKLLGIYNSERISYRKSLHERESVRERAIEQIRIETARRQCRGSYTNTITNRYSVNTCANFIQVYGRNKSWYWGIIICIPTIHKLIVKYIVLKRYLQCFFNCCKNSNGHFCRVCLNTYNHRECHQKNSSNVNVNQPVSKIIGLCTTGYHIKTIWWTHWSSLWFHINFLMGCMRDNNRPPFKLASCNLSIKWQDTNSIQ